MVDTGSPLVVRRSIHIAASPDRVWEELETFERMNAWWGALSGEPTAGTPNGMWLMAYEARVGGPVEMEVMSDAVRLRFGGRIVTFDRERELTFELDWIPNTGWNAPTFLSIGIAPAMGGSIVELLHYGFERTGADAAELHCGYEEGWGMTQLKALRQRVEKKVVENARA